jgi:sec-independent protein translocase protein TatA
MVPHLGPAELLLILLIVLILFGAGRLADIGSSLGRGIKEFRAAMREEGSSAAATTDERKREQA